MIQRRSGEDGYLAGVGIVWILFIGTGFVVAQNFSSERASYFAISSGVFIILFAYLLSCYFTGSAAPWALAVKPSVADVVNEDEVDTSTIKDGYAVANSNGASRLVAVSSNNRISLSKLQTLIYFIIALFAYVYVFALRFASGYSDPLPRFAPEVLILIGLSVATTAGAQAISINYQNNAMESESDKSDVIRNRDGVADLTKVQMLLWTVISAVIYMITLFNTSSAGCYIIDNPNWSISPLPDICASVWNNYDGNGGGVNQDSGGVIASWKLLGPLLPKFDSMLLILAGVVQGTYLSGRFMINRNPPRIDGAYLQISGSEKILKLVGLFDGIQLVKVDNNKGGFSKLYNFMVEITDDKKGSAILLNFKDSATVQDKKGNADLNGIVDEVKVFGTNILITNAVPEGDYTLRVSIDGVWSESKHVSLKT